MRKFWSYGSPTRKLHYHVPRQELIDMALSKLIGEDPDEGGHYITIWAPRQRGKTWIMENVLFTLRDDPQYDAFDVVHIPLESAKLKTDLNQILQTIFGEIAQELDLDIKGIKIPDDLERMFHRDILSRPLILILDEFDALSPEAISGIVSVFRNVYFRRRQQADLPSKERDYLLHGVALIGVRAVLGLENKSGSPFNIQHSIHIPNLTFEEVESMFKWYEDESGQEVKQAVIERVFYETNGQPGLVGWLGELLTETYNENKDEPITITNFNRTFLWATDGLGNANVLNIINKAKQAPYKKVVLSVFETREKKIFRYDDPHLNFLYLNGVIDIEEARDALYVKFASPFIQKRLFNYFSYSFFSYMGQMFDILDDFSDTLTPQGLHIKNLMHRYAAYLHHNKDWLLKDAPRRADLRLIEAVYHFNLYMYLLKFFKDLGGRVWPEFPTGNGKIDLIIEYEGKTYGLEVKSFANIFQYKKALTQAANYGKQIGLSEISLVFFIDALDDENRAKFEKPYIDTEINVTVNPIFVIMGA